MIKTATGLYILASEVAYIKDGYAYLFNGAKVRLANLPKARQR